MTKKKELIKSIQQSSFKRGVKATFNEAKQLAIDNGFIKEGKLTNKTNHISFIPNHKGQKPA